MEGSAADRKPIPFLRSEFNEFFGQLSPDSHWMAYTSDESGQREVYVRPFPSGDGQWKVSLTGGEQSRWRAYPLGLAMVVLRLATAVAAGCSIATKVAMAVTEPRPAPVPRLHRPAAAAA